MDKSRASPLKEEIYLHEFASPLLLEADYERWENDPAAQKRWRAWQAEHYQANVSERL